MNFIPSGYVSHEHVMDAIAEHLFPNFPDVGGPHEMTPEYIAAIKGCLNCARGLLFERRIIAYYYDKMLGTMFDHPIQEVDFGFWLSDRAEACLVTGSYDSCDGPQPLWFRSGAIEAALQPAPVPESCDSEVVAERPGRAVGGRPRKAEPALAAYDAVYPHGHRAVGDSWKEVERKVSDFLGEQVSHFTIQRALNSA